MFTNGLNKCDKEGMRPVGAGKKLGVELRSEHKGMVNQFGNFHEKTVGRKTREAHPVFLEPGAVGIFKFEAVTVSFFD